MKRFGSGAWWVVVLVAASCSSGNNSHPAAAGVDGGAGTAAAPGGGSGGSRSGGLGSGSGGSTAPASNASVLQYHKNSSRDGVYVDAAFTRAAAARLHKAYAVPIAGPTYAQPLFFEHGPGGKDIVIVATEQNEVSAFDAAGGAMVWRKTLGAPAPAAGCGGNIKPHGITGTPVIDPATKRLFLNAVTSEGGYKHRIYALSLDDGSTVDGWPVDVGAKVKAGDVSFLASVQNQRGALIILDGKVFVPYGGHAGDCGDYHGWVVGVPIDNPAAPIGWATRARAGGIWAPGGIASDGTSLFVATGNTMNESSMNLFSAPMIWGHGESILRLPSNLQFSEMDRDYASAQNWAALDNGDVDIGGSGPVLFSVAGATPAKLVLGLGKDSKAYLADAANLGGMGKWVATRTVSSQQIIQAAVAYNAPSGTFFAFRAMGTGCPSGSGKITAVRVGATSPPTLDVAWCAGSGGDGSPIVTTTDGSAESIVWYVAGDRKLHGFNGETGAVVFDGGSDAMTAFNKFQTPIAAKGKLFVAAGSELIAYSL